MPIAPAAFLFANLVAGFVLLVALVVSRLRLDVSRAPLCLWVAGDVSIELARMVMLLQPGMSSGGGITALSPDMALLLTSTAIVTSVVLHVFALMRATDYGCSGRCMMAIGTLAVVGYLAGFLLQPDRPAALQWLLVSSLTLSCWMFYFGWILRRMSAGAWLILAATSAVIVLNGYSVIWFLRHSEALVAFPSGPWIPPSPQLLVDLLVPSTMTLGFMLFMQDQVRTRIESLSMTDDLTALSNRRSFMSQLRREYVRVQRYGGSLALALLAVDDLRRLNGELGSRAGDRILSGIAARLSPVCRASDLLARWDGARFMLLMPETDIAAAAGVAERLRAAVAAEPLFAEAPGVTVSIGVCTSLQLPVRTGPDDLVACVDERLATARRLGNCVISSPGDSGRVMVERRGQTSSRVVPFERAPD